MYNAVALTITLFVFSHYSPVMYLTIYYIHQYALFTYHNIKQFISINITELCIRYDMSYVTTIVASLCTAAYRRGI